MHKVEFMISNGQYKRWRRYLILRYGSGKSLNKMIQHCVRNIVIDEMIKEADRALQRIKAVNKLTKGG